jgi:DNA-directed RNA polymerase II subunit RPB1
LKEVINVATEIKTPSLSVYLEPDIAKESMLAKNVQQKLTYTSLRTVTAAVEIWYDPNPSSTIIERTPSSLSRSLPSLMMRSSRSYTCSLHGSFISKMIDCKLTMAYIAGRITESFKTDLFVIWREDHSEKLIIHCHVLGGGEMMLR